MEVDYEIVAIFILPIFVIGLYDIGDRHGYWRESLFNRELCVCQIGLMPVAYLGGAWCDGPPLWPDHENFLQATLYEKVRFCRFPANLLKNG